MIGELVRVAFLDVNPTRVRWASGVLGVEPDEAGRIRTIVLESDGGATFIPRSWVIKIEPEA